jgi:hypothetical protein
MASTATTWRAYLGEIIREPEERRRLADELDVSEITLSRWASREPGAPRPHQNNLYRLIDHVAPHQKERLIVLLQQDFPDLQVSTNDSLLQRKEVPSLFAFRVLQAYNMIAQPYQRFWAIGHMVLQQALGQLDPDYHGIVATVVCCLPPHSSSSPIRSLYQTLLMSTRKELKRAAPLLTGVETLAGYVVSTCQPAWVSAFQQETVLPIWPLADEESAAAYPLMRFGRIAGTLVVSSLAPNFFTPARRELLAQYTQLLSLAFDEPDYFDPHTIRLASFPRPQYEQQRPYLESFRGRVAEHITQEATSNPHPRSVREVEITVLQAFEEAMLGAPLTKT